MKVGIIGAMEQEVALLRSQLSEPSTLQLGGCEFYQGRLAGKEVILTRSGIGKVAASVATSLLLEKFAPTASSTPAPPAASPRICTSETWSSPARCVSTTWT